MFDRYFLFNNLGAYARMSQGPCLKPGLSKPQAGQEYEQEHDGKAALSSLLLCDAVMNKQMELKTQ